MALYLDSWLAEMAVATTAVVLLLLVRLFRRFSYWSSKGVPQIRPLTPLGNCGRSVLGKKMYAQDLDRIYHQLRDYRYAGFYRKQAPGLMIIDPELIRQVFVKDFDYFTDREQVNFREPILDNQLFFMKGDRWRRLRNKLSPIFTSGKLKTMFQTLNDCAGEMVEVLSESAEQGRVLEFREACALYTTEVIGSLAFGVKLDCQHNPDCDFRRWARSLFHQRPPSYSRIAAEILTPSFLKYHRYKYKRLEVFEYFENMAKETLHQRLESKMKRNDFMELFIQLHTKGFVEGEKNGTQTWKMTEDEVVAQAFLFYTAGFETSSTTMSFTTYELAVNPDIQERVQSEVDAALGESGAVTYETLKQMKYLDQVLSETLRKYPPVATLTRETMRPYRLPSPKGDGSGVLLDTGTIVSIPLLSLQRDPHHFPDPERFDPERFSEEARAKRHPFAYLPFGEGPRFCIGMRLGLLQAKLGLAHLLSHYSLEVCRETDIPLPLDPVAPVLMAQRGIRLRLTKRAAKHTA